MGDSAFAGFPFAASYLSSASGGSPNLTIPQTQITVLPKYTSSATEDVPVTKSSGALYIYEGGTNKRYVEKELGINVYVGGEVADTFMCLYLSLGYFCRRWLGTRYETLDEAAISLKHLLNDGCYRHATYGDESNIIRFVEKLNLDVYVVYNECEYSVAYCAGKKLRSNKCIALRADGSHFRPYIPV